MNTINQAQLLSKIGITELNPMQEEAQKAILSGNEVILLSPTGTGKTLAFLLPILQELDTECKEIQTLIVVPSRELAIQIEQVIRNLGTGFKANAVYGGRSGSKDRMEIKHRPAILIGTPGRLADHLRREAFDSSFIKTIVFDEFDKSLEIGFEPDMIDIVENLPRIQKRILTSATYNIEIPIFIGLQEPVKIDYLDQKIKNLEVRTVISPTKDKLKTLESLICNIGYQPGIIFCNFKDSIKEVSEYLTYANISHGCFYGGLEQKDRERALIKFRNGTYQVIVATDLAARGLDIPELKFIIHYELPSKEQEFTHRNGRTARMNADGTAYVIKWISESLPTYMNGVNAYDLKKAKAPQSSNMITLYISGGRKDKISKGDIAGLFFKQGKLNKDELGIIELKHDCAFVAVSKDKASDLIPLVNNTKLKKKKVRITVLD